MFLKLVLTCQLSRPRSIWHLGQASALAIMRVQVKKSGRITHGNKQVKAVLTEAAWAATRTKNTFFSERYHRISARRGKKRALIAVAHSQLTAAYLILSTGARYHELGAQ